MKCVGFIASGATACLLASARPVAADRAQVDRLFVPELAAVTLDDGSRVDAKVDHEIIDRGARVQLALRATGVAGKRVAVGVLVLGTTGSEDDPFTCPTIGVAQRTVQLAVDATGHATADVALRLRGAGSGKNPLAHYTILVLEPRAAARLDELRRRAVRAAPRAGGDPSVERFTHAFWAIQGMSTVTGEVDAAAGPREAAAARGDASMFTRGKAARIDVHALPVPSALAIAAPTTARAGEAFTVAVTLTNPSRSPRRGIEVSLDSLDATIENFRGSGYRGLEYTDVTIVPEQATLELAGRETRRVEFRVTGAIPGTIGFFARAASRGDAATRDALWAGAIDAAEIVHANPDTRAR